MKKILVLALLLAGCIPVRYVYINPKDSTKVVEVRKRVIYQDIYEPSPIYLQPYPFYYSPRIVVPYRGGAVHYRRR